MKDRFSHQRYSLYKAVSAFEPYIPKLHGENDKEGFFDWPTVILATTAQCTAVSLFKILPDENEKTEILDKRSIASLVRNLVDTHDVIDLMINTESSDEFELNRDILGMYLAGRINKVQESIDKPNAQQFFKHSKQWYWDRIKKSPLYSKRLERIKSGETVFYKSRRERVERACSKDTDFVLSVLVDISTFVHSVPPTVWFDEIENIFINSVDTRNLAASWLRIANFYMARIIEKVVIFANFDATEELAMFLGSHKTVFSESAS